MSFITRSAVRLIDSVAVVLSQAYQLARIRLASAASPVLRLMVRRDQALNEVELLRRELSILRAQRESMPPHRRTNYHPEQRLAILQLHRLCGWIIHKTAQRFVLHPNTLRSWIKAAEGRGNGRLFTGAIVWNKIDDAVRWASHELRRLCPQPEFGTRTIARHLVRAGIAISRSTVQRVLRQPESKPPPRRKRPAMAKPIGEGPHHLLAPTCINHVWHMDFTCLRILWFRLTLVAILDGFSRKLLCLRVHAKTPKSSDMVRLVHQAAQQHDQPRLLITDHGTQFRKSFSSSMHAMNICHVKGRVRTPYLNGKVERSFRTFRIWWRCVLTGLSPRTIQRQFDAYRRWYNHHRPHAALNGLTPEEAWQGRELPQPIAFRASGVHSPHIRIRRIPCRGDPYLPVIEINVRKAA